MLNRNWMQNYMRKLQEKICLKHPIGVWVPMQLRLGGAHMNNHQQAKAAHLRVEIYRARSRVQLRLWQEVPQSVALSVKRRRMSTATLRLTP